MLRSGEGASAGRASSSRADGRSRAASRTPRRGGVEVYDEDAYREDVGRAGGARREKGSGFSAVLSARRKAKAGREFERRYAAQDAAGEGSGPRAALYKGQMGASQKKASRMQNGAARTSSARSAGFAAKRRRLAHPALLYGLLAAVACLAFAFVVVYPAARDYYVMMRATAQQQAEYDALTARHDYIQAEVDRLSTDEGMEDEASKELGWVKEGENAVYVNGLDKTEETPVYADVPTGSVPAPDTWYSGFLDPLFGVDPKTVGTTTNG